MAMAMLLSPLKPLAFPYSAFSQDPSSSSSSYRPAVFLPGLGNDSADYQKLELTLRGYGVSTVVAKVSRIDWLMNAAGLVDPNYWRSRNSQSSACTRLVGLYPSLDTQQEDGLHVFTWKNTGFPIYRCY